MKEQINTLKDSAVKIAEQRKNFIKQKLFFNLKVEEKKEELAIEELFNTNNDSYKAAMILNFTFPEIYSMVSIIRNEHPKYGNKRIKQIIIDKVKMQDGASEELIQNFNNVIDNYFLYESCGFIELKEKEDKIISLESEVRDCSKGILYESKEATIKLGNSVVNIVKPYGEVAKSQIEDASKAAKGFINKGSKQLMKILKNIEEKTNQK